MLKDIGSALKNSKTLHHVKRNLVKLFRTAKEGDGIVRIGYVTGIITSDGPNISRQIENGWPIM